MEPFDGRAVTGGKGRVWAVKGRWGARIIKKGSSRAVSSRHQGTELIQKPEIKDHADENANIQREKPVLHHFGLTPTSKLIHKRFHQ
jgi:hypothetical protein